MAGKVLRDIFVIGSVSLAMAYAAIHREQIYEYFGVEVSVTRKDDTNAHIENLQASESNAVLPMTAMKGVAVSIPKSKRDGHYWTTARVNSGMVDFLVDTGASIVALTPEDARRAGIKLDELKYDFRISTAGGENVAARVNIEVLSVGPITLRDVPAIVVPRGLNSSLLGMSFLGQLQEVKATPYELILRL